MRILVLNGSPRPKGNTKQMVDAFQEGAESAGHKVDVLDVCRKKIAEALKQSRQQILLNLYGRPGLCPAIQAANRRQRAYRRTA